MKKLILLTLLIDCIIFLSYSQPLYTDSVRKKNNYRWLLSQDTRGSIVREVPVLIGGIKTGIEINKRHRVGVGFYFMGMPILGLMIFKPAEYNVNQSKVRTVFVNHQHVGQDTTQTDNSVSLKMVYGTVYYEYVVFQRRRWEISIPLQVGLGQATYQTHVVTSFTNPRTHEKEERSFNRPDENNLIFLGELSINAHYKIFTWLGVGVGLGYRRLFNDNNNPKIADTFDYAIWLWKIKLFPFELKSVFKGKSKWYAMD